MRTVVALDAELLFVRHTVLLIPKHSHVEG